MRQARLAMKLASTLALTVVASGLVLAVGCGGMAPTPNRQPSAQRVPDAVVEDEALIDDALAQARDTSAACPDRCRSAGAVCEAAERICTIVDELRDVSLAPRCDRARLSCESGRESVSSCGCAAGSPAE